MPFRIKPDKALLIYYDAPSDSWRTREGISIALLSQFVEIEPGVTVDDVFRLIDGDIGVKQFLSEYCSCDIDAIKTLPPLHTDKPLEVPTALKPTDEGALRATANSPVDTVVICPSFYAYKDEATGQRRLEGSYVIHGKSSQHDLISMGFGGENAVHFADIKDCFLTLDTALHLEDYDTDQVADRDTDSSGFSAHIRYTLLNVLGTLVRHFGDERFDSRYQPDIDYERMLEERHERIDESQDDGDTPGDS